MYTHRFIVATNFFKLGSQGLQTALADAQLVECDLQLALYLVVVGLQFLKQNTVPLLFCWVQRNFQKIVKILTVRVSDCFLMVFWRSMLVLLATSSESSSSVIWIWSFFLTRCTSVFSLISASTTRAFNCSISMLVCLLINEKTKIYSTDIYFMIGRQFYWGFGEG